MEVRREEELAIETEPETKIEDGTALCSVCNLIVPDSKYCMQCGSPISAEAIKMTYRADETALPLSENIPKAKILTEEYAGEIIEAVALQHGPIKHKSGKRGVRLENKRSIKYNARKTMAAILEGIALQIAIRAKELSGNKPLKPKHIEKAKKELLSKS